MEQQQIPRRGVKDLLPETEEEWIPDEAVFFASPSETVSGEREEGSVVRRIAGRSPGLERWWPEKLGKIAARVWCREDDEKAGVREFIPVAFKSTTSQQPNFKLITHLIILSPSTM